MIGKKEVLELIARRSRENRETSYRSLVREFDLSVEAACGHLKRLWAGRLIEPASPRLPGFRFRLEPRECIRELRFRVAKRGVRRLAWYEEHKEEGWFQ